MKITFAFAIILLNCFQQFILSYCSSDDLLESWKKINTNYANDIQEGNKIYYQIKEEQRALAELRTIVERHLRSKNAELLVNAMHSDNISTPIKRLKEILEEFDLNYDVPMIESIINEAINEFYVNGQVAKLPDLLWNIYQKNNTKLYQIMLRAQLRLYNSFGQKQNVDRKEFLHLFANKLHAIKKERLYDAVDLNLKLKVQNVIQQLPNNLKYLYFMPKFCLLNIKHSTYIYTAIELKVDPLSRYIWLWKDNKSMDDTGYIKAEVGELHDSNEQGLNVALKGIKYQMYYYMMPSSMKIAGWDSTDTPLNYIWNIEFLDDDNVVFSQNDYLMCAGEKYDNERRNVGGRKRGEVSSMSPECQWRLGECIFN